MLAAAEAARRPSPLSHRLLGVALEGCLAGVAGAAFAAPPLLAGLCAAGVAPAWTGGMAAALGLWWVAFLVTQLRLLPERGPAELKGSDPGPVLIIGAGPAGLATLKECRALALDAWCFEAQAGVGGVFRFDPELASGSWEGVRLTSSPWVTAFSDFPPEGDPEHEVCSHDHRADYVAYLERYARAFELGPRLKLEHRVRGARRHPDGGWVLDVERPDGAVEQVRGGRLAVCTGSHRRPRAITLPGLESFSGQVLHAAEYKRPADFAGRRVVVVGFGESAVDIALELVGVAAEVTLSARRAGFVIPRINPLTGDVNDFDTNRARYATPQAIRDAVATFKRWTCGLLGTHSPESAARAALLRASRAGPFSQASTKSAGFIDAVLDGRLTLRRTPRSVSGARVAFEDGGEAEVDVLLYAHGFDPELLTPEGLPPRHPGQLYRRMFHPEAGEDIAWIGFARPNIGAIPPVAELQARLFALVAAGRRALPSPEAMEADISRTLAAHARRFPTRVQPDILVEWIPFMDALAAEVGCRPKLGRLLRDPALLRGLLVGPATSAHYRLSGPGAAPVAAETTRALPRRHGLGELLTLVALHFWAWPLSLLRGDPRARSSHALR